MKKILLNKKGNIPIILCGLIMTFILPMLGFIVDISNAKIIKQDLKYIAETAVLSCVAESENTIDNNKCTPTIKEIVDKSKTSRNYNIYIENIQYKGKTGLSKPVSAILYLKTDYKPVFLPIFGIKNITLKSNAQITARYINEEFDIP